MWKALLNADTILRVIVDDSILKNEKVCRTQEYSGFAEYFLIKPIAPKNICICHEKFTLAEDDKYFVMMSKIEELTTFCSTYLKKIVLPNSMNIESKLLFLNNMQIVAAIIKETIENFNYNELPMDYILDYISSGEQTLFTMVQATPKTQLMLYDLLRTYPTKDPNVLWLHHWIEEVLMKRIRDYGEQNGLA